MANRMKRLVAIALSAVASIGLITTNAYAESDAVTRAQRALDQIKEQAAQIDADYAQAENAYKEAEQKLKHTDADISELQIKVEQLRTNLGELALMQYRNNSVDVTAQLIAAPDMSRLLSSLATLNGVSKMTNDNLLAVENAQVKLDRLRAEAEESAQAMKAEKDKQIALLAKNKKREEAAAKVLKGLKDEERARLLAAQRAAAARAAENARRAVSTMHVTSKATNQVAKPEVAGSDRAAMAVRWAMAQIGKRYIFASSGPGSFDCSGLTSAAYRAAGISLPHQSRSQFAIGQRVSRDNLRPGDLLFFYRGITHVGIYVGNGVMVHSSPSGRGVHLSNLATYPAYQGARRVA